MTRPTTDIQSPSIGTIVELFDVDCTALFGEILRFTPSPLIPNRLAPVPAPGAKATSSYSVVKGDTLSGIAHKIRTSY